MVLRSLLAVAVLVTACTTASPTPRVPADEPTISTRVPANVEQVDGLWLLRTGTVNGRLVPMPAETRTTITIVGAEFSGQTACNTYGGRMRVVGHLVAVGEILQTLIGCVGERQDSERTFIAALRAVTAIWFDGEELVLTGPGVELRFTQLPDVQPGEVVDRDWVLDTLVRDGRAAAAGGMPATLLVGSDGTFSGSTGCRTFRGEWFAGGDQIRVTAIDMAGAECPAFLEAQDNHVITVIATAFFPLVKGDELTLSTVSGDALIYHAVT